MSFRAKRKPLTPVLVRMLEGRSGSTLLMQLLGTSPAIAFDRVYPFENSYLTFLVKLTGLLDQQSPGDTRMADLIYGDKARLGAMPFEPQLLDGAEMARKSLGSLWSDMAASLEELTPATRFYAEKYWADIDPVIAAGIRPVVIDLIRDPRDVVSSIRAFNNRLDRPFFGRAQANDDDDHLRHLNVALSFRFQELAKPLPVPRLSVRYEDLVADLAGQSALIGAFLNEHIYPEAVVAARPSMSHHITSSSVESSVGRWKTDMPIADIHSIERRLGRHMVANGYELSRSPVPVG